jgi:DNA-binding NarL/FixJ family response regulator
MIQPKQIRIVIAEDHLLFAEGLERLLNEDALYYKVVAKAVNGLQLLESVKKYLPDLVLVDVNMPLLNGIEAAIRIRKRYQHIKIVFISMDKSPSLVNLIRQNGFDGLVPKDSSVDILKNTIQKVMRHDKVYPLHPGHHTYNPSLSITKLSPRQLQVIELIRQGTTTNKEIASQLAISVLTVETHLKNIFQILSIKNKLELMQYAL